MEYDPFQPPEEYDFEIVSNDPEYAQYITLPTPAEPGVITTIMTELTTTTENLRQRVFCSVYERDVRPILTGAGMQYKGVSIYLKRRPEQNWSRYEFTHPEVYSRALTTLSMGTLISSHHASLFSAKTSSVQLRKPQPSLSGRLP